MIDLVIVVAVLVGLIVLSILIERENHGRTRREEKTREEREECG